MNTILIPNGGDHFGTDEEFFIFLKMMAKKGFYDIFEYVSKNEPAEYHMISSFVEQKNIVKKDMLGIILGALSNMGLIELARDKKGTSFELTEFGRKIANGLDATKSTFTSE